ncbi:MAG: aldehyde dehydrogenase family protein [Planctomycetales bacterium]|nr:aldehyde dehydrogenase family protein [Planctomycetales bacterium]
MVSEHPYWLANQPQMPNTALSVTDKYSGLEFAKVALASEETVRSAIAAAAAASHEMRKLPAYQRQAILLNCISRFEQRREELAQLLCLEAGKPIRDSRGEVTRLIDTFRIAAEETVRINGEVLDLEISPRAHGYRGMVQRVPVGPCAFISPFNFPLNLAAHKIAPAIAAGCPWILKPASRTPLSALVIGEILAETSLPTGAFSILPCTRTAAEPIVTDDRIKLLSFTGSPNVGWDLKARARKKKVTLELGGNAATIVEPDADLNDVVERLIVGAFYQSGQSCISVQRILVHEIVYEQLRELLVARTRTLQMGDPRDEKTFIGPIISLSEAQRIKAWIDEAVAGGASLLCGGNQNGCMVDATLLEDVPEALPVCAREVFGPVAILSQYANFEDALRQVNASDFGLQAGVFTRDLYRALRAWDEIEVGGVVVGDVPSWRVDHMPYGGVKDSGLGREGVRYAIEDMTEPRLLVIRENNK